METTIESLEVSMEDTTREIEVLELELKNIQDSKIPNDLKAEFSRRLEGELIWLETILEDERKSIEFLEFKYCDDKADNDLEELKLSQIN